jgi:hypothetical protein
MSEDYSVFERKITCDHAMHKSYKQRRFDMVYGYELVDTKCLNCHKIISLEIKKLN